MGLEVPNDYGFDEKRLERVLNEVRKKVDLFTTASCVTKKILFGF